jgi:hypothetical protein
MTSVYERGVAVAELAQESLYLELYGLKQLASRSERGQTQRQGTAFGHPLCLQSEGRRIAVLVLKITERMLRAKLLTRIRFNAPS